MERTSPFASVWREQARGARAYEAMQLPHTCADEAIEQKRLAYLAIADVSAVPRVTVKGAGASALLTDWRLPTPSEWFAPRALGGWGFVARTGAAEFFIEGAGPASAARPAYGHALLNDATAADAWVYPKYDGSLVVCGAALGDLLGEVLSTPFERADGKLFFTQLAGVACVLWERTNGLRPAVQLWVDPTYCAYVGRVLLRLAEQGGGGWVGSAAMSAAGLVSWEESLEVSGELRAGEATLP